MKGMAPANICVLKAAGFVFLLAFILICIDGTASGQDKPELPKSIGADSAVENNSSTEHPVKSSSAQSRMKVTFDEKSPGVVIVESNGEKLRIDTNKKTVEPVDAVISEPAERSEKAAKTKEEMVDADLPGEGKYDFEAGEEPYDYRLINVPTPKKVPKGTWNMTFTHRFTQPLHPISSSAETLFGLDSFGIASFGISYGITDKLYVSAYRSPLCQKGLCRTIEIGLGYNWLEHNVKSPVAFSTYASVEGNENFSEEYTYNLQARLSARLGKRVYLFFSPAVHLNANGQRRFNPRPNEFFPPATIANTFKLPTHGASFGFGTSVMITPDLLALFEFTPRAGFKLGRVTAIFDSNFRVIDFRNDSEPEIGVGVQKNIGKHSFALTFSNTQTTTTSRYNSSNLVLSPRRWVIGFNLSRRF